MQLVPLPQDKAVKLGTTPPIFASGAVFQAKSFHTSDTAELRGTTTQSCGAPHDSGPFRPQFLAPAHTTGRSGEASCQPALCQISAYASSVCMQKVPQEQDSGPISSGIPASTQVAPFQSELKGSGYGPSQASLAHS
jgi:hypothetical protein